MNNTVLITGVNSGFGYLIANTLVKSGYKVIGSMREPSGRNASVANELRNKGIVIVDIDVTDEQSVLAGVEEATRKVGTIDILINNAGVGTLGWQDSFNIDDFKKVFDINVFGVQRMVKAVLPNMKKQGKGTIIQISSILGQFVLPFLGSYNATKHAVEGMTENYRVELSQFGIQSLIVQPGGFGTDFGANLLRSSDSSVTESYGEAAGAPEQMWANTEKGHDSEDAPDPQMVADAVLSLLETLPKERPFRTTVDGTGLNSIIESVNEAREKAMKDIYSMYEMDNLLKLNND